jgi:predicted PurR-regulated permease PerM
MNKESVHRWALLLLVLLISALFLAMIRQFLVAIFLAGLFAALARPLYQHLVTWFRGRRVLASLTTLVLITLIVLLPLSGLLGIITAQAVKVGEAASPWIERQLKEPDQISGFFKRLPFSEHIQPYRNEIFQKAGEIVGKMSSFLIDSLSSVTVGTVHFIVMILIILYTMFFFLMDGDKLLMRMLFYVPLKYEDERRILEQFTSVARATLKGTAVIGILQGTLAGLAFAVVGIPSAVFWGAIMTIASIIPSVGSALIWGPAALILALHGQIGKAIGLTVFCAAIVGSLDNLLRPILVGKDTQMHELLIFFSTLGGILMFGIVGILIGPIIAALFSAIWDLYGLVFQDLLPPVAVSSTETVQEVSKGEPNREP